MKNRVLHLIEPTFDFTLVNNNSKLLTSVGTYIDLNEYHTSLGDMSSSDILTVSEKFHTINFVSHQFDHCSDIYKETVVLLNYFSKFKNVTNFVPDPCLLFENTTTHPNIDRPALWVFGCSHSHGVGLLPNEKTFGKLVAEQMNLPLVLISKPGSSLHWSLRQIMTADIQPNDNVIWQITAPDRITQFNHGMVKEVMLSQTDDRYLLEVFNSDQIFFNQITLLNFGIKYLRSRNIKFTIVSILPKLEKYYDYLIEYSKFPEYCYTPGCDLDFGTDQLHFGPLSHQAIAQRIVNHVQC